MGHTQRRILAEATRQLVDGGYTAFTVAGVRDALGLSSGSMFHAFPSKAALAAAVYVEGLSNYQQTAISAITRQAAPEQALRDWIAAHLCWIEAHRGLARLLFATQPDEVMAAATEPLAAHNRRFYEVLAALFARAAAAGLMGPLEWPVAQAICLGPAHEYGRLWARGRADTPPSQLSNTIQDAALAALATTLSPGLGRKRKEPPP